MEDAVNAFLAPLALLNDGTNHGSSYELVRLPLSDSLIASTSLYFESLTTSIVQQKPAEHWNIRTGPINCDWKSHVQKVAKRWFFAQEYSPKVESWVADNVVEYFTSILQPVIGHARLYDLQITPPMWYECVWEDILIDSRNGRWLMHFGFSD